MFPMAYDRSLVDTCTLVRTLKFQQLVFIFAFAIITQYDDLISIDEIDDTGMLCNNCNTGILRC